MINLKQSIRQYRNIDGVLYECYSSNPGEFKQIRTELRDACIRSRIIQNQLYKEVKKQTA